MVPIINGAHHQWCPSSMVPIINITVATKKKQLSVNMHVAVMLPKNRPIKSCTSFHRHVQRVVLKHVFGVNTRPLPDIRLEQQFDRLCNESWTKNDLNSKKIFPKKYFQKNISKKIFPTKYFQKKKKYIQSLFSKLNPWSKKFYLCRCAGCSGANTCPATAAFAGPSPVSAANGPAPRRTLFPTFPTFPTFSTFSTFHPPLEK
jgi:hypothetical protein